MVFDSDLRATPPVCSVMECPPGDENMLSRDQIERLASVKSVIP